MSIRVLQIKARNKSQHRIQNSKKLYTQTSNKMGALSQCGSSKKRNILLKILLKFNSIIYIYIQNIFNKYRTLKLRKLF